MNKPCELSLSDKVISARTHCKYGSCVGCPYNKVGNVCHEYLLADCCRLLSSNLDRNDPVFELISKLLTIYD